MKILDVEQLIAYKREKREARMSQLAESMRERHERIAKRTKDEEEYYEEEIRKHADFVSQCLSEYSPDRLHTWFLLDHWTVQEGLILLSGFDPKDIPLDEKGEISIPYFSEERRKISEISSIRRLDNLTPFAEMTEDIIGETRTARMALNIWHEHSQILRIWKSGVHSEERYPPKYFIDWAISKKLSIDWLDWAKAEGYYGEQSIADETPLSPRARNNYLGIIGALADHYWKTTYPGQNFKQAKILEDLLPYTGFPGLTESQTHLKKTLTQAMNLIDQK